MKYTVLYDGQCEVCQACFSWLRALDRRGLAQGLPLEDADLSALGSLSLDDCLAELHVVDGSGRVHRGWDACRALAKLSPWTWPVWMLGGIPPFSWLGRLFYGWIAKNRYLISKCRGGACRSARTETVRARSSFLPFWSCYFFGLLVRAPLSLALGLRNQWRHLRDWAATFRRKHELLDGRLTVMFIGGLEPEIVPLVFGERFCALLYRGVLLDPGSPKMRASLRGHFGRLGAGAVRHVVGTHHHEEHVGNLEMAARYFQAPLWVPEKTLAILRDYPRLPWARDFAIGQPENLALEPLLLKDGEPVGDTGLIAYEAPGHCDDQVVLYDPSAKVILAGDAFMGSYFSTPNPDVDSRKWIDSLERLLALEVDYLVEGHGHVHTLDPRVPDLRGLVVREDPKRQLREKLDYLRWVRDQVERGMEEGLPPRAIEASCFPWTERRVWENFTNDKLTALLSGGQFSNQELIRSFKRGEDDGSIFPVERRFKVYS